MKCTPLLKAFFDFILMFHVTQFRVKLLLNHFYKRLTRKPLSKFRNWCSKHLKKGCGVFFFG